MRAARRQWQEGELNAARALRERAQPFGGGGSGAAVSERGSVSRAADTATTGRLTELTSTGGTVTAATAQSAMSGQ
jgi:Ethanolamine utilization protein EutJ (predicted chaperonin)